jgi:hypothetical protein
MQIINSINQHLQAKNIFLPAFSFAASVTYLLKKSHGRTSADGNIEGAD